MIGYDKWHMAHGDYRDSIDGTCIGGRACGMSVPSKNGNKPLRFEAYPGVWYYRTDGYTKADQQIYRPE
jgi:hypothetical protein